MLASVTQAVVPTSTANAKALVGLPPIMPDENNLPIACPVVIDRSPPASVAAAPHTMAVRYLVTPAPARVATPLDTSLAPLAAARTTRSNKMAGITVSPQGFAGRRPQPEHMYLRQPGTTAVRRKFG